MNKKPLGRTGLMVSQLGFGAMELRGPKVWDGRDVSDRDAERLLNAVLDEGINFIDTSVDYGLSEERIGRFIASRRDEYFLATKCGCDPRDLGDRWETRHTWNRATVMRNIEGSLQRLRTDQVDVLQLHSPAIGDVRNSDVVEALAEVRAQGLARFIGVSTALPDAGAFLDMGVFDVFQVPYSCLENSHHDFITRLGQAGVGVIVRSGLAAGMLFGGTSAEPWWQERAARLRQYAGRKGRAEIAALALRYTLSHPHCHSAIIGTSSIEHLAENVEAARLGGLPAAEADKLQRHMAGDWWRRLARRARQAFVGA